jgi:hypothetical protein
MFDAGTSGLYGQLHRQIAIGMNHDRQTAFSGCRHDRRQFITAELGRRFDAELGQAVQPGVDQLQMVPPGLLTEGTLNQGLVRFHRDADQFSVSALRVACPARRRDSDRRWWGRGHFLFISQGVSVVVPAVSNGQHTASQVLMQMVRYGFPAIRKIALQLVPANGRVGRPGHHQVNVAVDQCRKDRAISQIDNCHSLGLRIIGIRNPLDSACADNNHPVFERRTAGSVDEPSDTVTKRC